MIILDVVLFKISASCMQALGHTFKNERRVADTLYQIALVEECFTMTDKIEILLHADISSLSPSQVWDTLFQNPGMIAS